MKIWKDEKKESGMTTDDMAGYEYMSKRKDTSVQ